MRAILLASLAPVMALAAVPGFAQETSGDTDSQDFQVIGYVPPLCSVGAPDNSGGVFDVGLLIDTTTGFLRSDLSAPSKTLSGAFCSARSTIAIEATPMAAQGFAGTVPVGFSSAVDYLASASGWTETPASWNTAAASNAAAVQTRGGAFTGDITVAVSSFATAGGATLRPVADDQYLGEITVTLTASE